MYHPSRPLVPPRSSSLPTQSGNQVPAVSYNSNIPAIPPAGSQSMSTFNDHSITSAAYVSVRSVLKLPKVRSVRGNLRREIEPTEDEEQRNCYYDPGLLIRGRVYFNRPLGLMVDNAGRVIVPSVPNPIANPGLVTRMSQRLATTPWIETAKATYRVIINFHERTNRGGFRTTPSGVVKLGVAVHIGEGLFLTNLHVLQWIPGTPVAQVTHTTHKARIWLFSGSGNLDNKSVITPNRLVKGSLEVEAIGWPSSALGRALMNSQAIYGGLMDRRFETDIRDDFCLLEAIERRWKATLRSGSRPHVLSGNVLGPPTPLTLTVTWVGINGPTEEQVKYDPAVNSRRHLKDALKALNPGIITYVTTTQAVRSVCPAHTIALPGVNPDIIRYPISTSGGSSGTGIYESTSKRLIGLHCLHELDHTNQLAPDVTDISITSPENMGCAVLLTSQRFRDFVREIVIPNFLRIGTLRAQRLANNWGRMVVNAPYIA